jgi:hypothetical protein
MSMSNGVKVFTYSLFKAFPTRMFSRACLGSTLKRVAILSIRSGRKVPEINKLERKTFGIDVSYFSFCTTHVSW